MMFPRVLSFGHDSEWILIILCMDHDSFWMFMSFFPNKSAIQYMLMCCGSVSLKINYPSLNITANTWTSSLSKGCSHITKYQSNWMMFSLLPAHIVSMDHARFIHFHIATSLDFFPLIIMSGVLNSILCGAISWVYHVALSCLSIYGTGTINIYRWEIS